MSAPVDDSGAVGQRSEFVQRPMKARSWRDSVMRPGALDYREIPSVAGEDRLPHVGPTSFGKRAIGATGR